MADEQDRAALLGHITHFAQAFPLEFGIPDCQHFIHHQDLRFQVGSHGKGQAHIHARRITFDRRIDELLDFGKIHDLIELAVDLGPFHSQDGAVQVDILTPGQFGMKARAHFQQAGNPAL